MLAACYSLLSGTVVIVQLYVKVRKVVRIQTIQLPATAICVS